MSRNEVGENLINHYLQPLKERRTTLKSLSNTKKSGKNLQEFYNEVQKQRVNYTIQNIYNGKSAVEIELMMMNNRQLIEANYTKR